MAATEGKHVCNFPGCERKFPKEWRLVEHLRSHTGERPFACGHEGCDKRFIRPFHLKRHELTHSKEKKYICTHQDCGKSFPTNHNLKRHQQRTHGKPFKCEFEGCSREFSKHKQLKNHMCSHTGENPYRCDAEGCESSFKTSQKLIKHQKKHMNGYICGHPGCCESFQTWSMLRKHSVTHKTACETCGKVFADPENMRKHTVVHSESREVFVCPREGCERFYSKVSILRKHIDVFHEGARPFSCTIEGCDKIFAHKSTLKKHIGRHNIPKPIRQARPKKSIASHLTGYTPTPEDTALRSVSINESSNQQMTSVHNAVDVGEEFVMHVNSGVELGTQCIDSDQTNNKAESSNEVSVVQKHTSSSAPINSDLNDATVHNALHLQQTDSIISETSHGISVNC